jgi:hypothetical protein
MLLENSFCALTVSSVRWTNWKTMEQANANAGGSNQRIRRNEEKVLKHLKE